MDFRQDPLFSTITSQLETSRGLPSGLLGALVGTESSGNPNARSPVGAQGLTQFMPETAKQYAVNTSDPVDSLRGTADFLQDLIHKYDGNVKAALAHYNGGAHNARYQVDGTAPSPQHVSPQNFAVNQKYVQGIMSKVDAPKAEPADYVGKVNALVTGLAKSGASPDLIVNQLMRDPATADLVNQGIKAGDKAEQIVANLGGAGYAQIAAAKAKVGAQGFGTNLLKGAGNAIEDLGTGAKQIGATITGDDERLAQLNAEEAARRQDPERRAQQDTWGSTIGAGGVKAAPYVAAALVPELGIPAMAATQGAVGATMGALQPTTAEGQRGTNILHEGAGAAIGGAAAPFIAKGVNATAAKLLRPSADTTAESAAVKAARDQLGWGSTVADLNPTARALRDSLPSAKAASEDLMRQDLAKTVLGRIGQTGDAISTENIATARATIYNEADDLLKNVKIPQDTTKLAPKLEGIVQKYEADTLPTYRSAEVASAVKDVIAKIEAGQMSGAALVQARKNIMGNAWKADGDTKVALRAIGDAIDSHIGSVAPAVRPVLAKANDQWRHLQVVENALNRVNGQGDQLTPRAFAQSVKVANRDQFQAGTAPYQDVVDALFKSQGTDSSKSLAGLAAKHLNNSSDGVLTGAAFFEPVSALSALAAKKLAASLLEKAVNSDSPSALRMLAGVGGKDMDPVMKSYIMKALSGSGAVTGAELGS